MEAIQFIDLCKAFGDYKVIDGLTFNVSEHCVFGFLGENGAGKTTTMKMLLGLLKPDSGTIKVMNETVTYGNTATNKYIGYLADVPEFYGFMTSQEYLKLCGEITGLSKTQISKKSEELLHLVGLEGNKRKIANYSRGMKQRLGLAQALLNSPQILVCDEPTSALDPVGRKEVLDIIKQVSNETTVMFSTHVLSDIERICDRVGVLKSGKIVLNGTLQELKQIRRTNVLEMEFRDNADLEQFAKLDYMSSVEMAVDMESLCINIKSENIYDTYKMVLQKLAETTILPNRFEVLEPTLEDVFLEVIQ